METHSAMGMADHMSMMNEDLSKVNAADFDKAFLKAMIDHHQMAVDMVIGARNTENLEIINFGKKVIEVQWTEIKQMKAWLEA